MRAGIVLISPLVPIIKSYFHINNLAVSILAGIPVLCFSASSILMTFVNRLGGSNRVIRFALYALTIGLIGRMFGGLFGLFFFTLVVGISIAIMNYEIPTWIKEHAPDQTGAMTGAYVTLMGICAGFAVAISVPLAKLSTLSWRGSMIPWVVTALIASLYWNRKKVLVSNKSIENSVPFWQTKMFKNPIAWSLVLFFGFQSIMFYGTATWLPTILTTKGFSLELGALYISIAGIIGSLVGLTVPHYLSKLKDKRRILIFLAFLQTFSYFMMIQQRGHIIFFWLLLTNIGMSIQFPVGLMMAGLKTKTIAETRALSTMMQSIGYLIAALGPTYIGTIFDITQSWNWALVGIAIISLGLAFFSFVIGKDSIIQ